MGKVVTIPKDRNPFVVIVNGVKYSYPAGATTEVPDEVADVIEKYVGAKPKPDPNAGINFGGTQSYWNQTDSSAADFIKNKPFGDMPTGGDTLYWDGNTEGLVAVEQTDMLGFVYYKLSESTPRMEDIAEGGSLSAFNTPDGDFVMDITVEDYGGLLFCCSGMVIVIPSDNFEFDDGEGTYLSFPEKGVYFAGSEGVSVSYSLTIPGYTGFPVTKKMDEKYLPGAVILYADEENYLYTTSDTSDTSKRMTRAELMSVMQSGRVAYCTMTDETGTGYLPVQTYTFMEEYGQAMLVLFMGQSFLGYSVYTAEYVPE